jgi:hypothetical protein
MKCDIHPDRYATTKCLSCKASLCDECTVPLDDGRLMCDRCSLLTILQARHQKAREKLQTKKRERDLGAAHKKRLGYIWKWAPIFGVLIIVLIGANYYLNIPIIESQVIDLEQHPDAMMLVLDQAIRDYAEDNEGDLPNTLGDLIGKYLPREKFKWEHVSRFVYDRKSDNSYRIRPKQQISSPIPNLVMTEKGLELENVPK